MTQKRRPPLAPLAPQAFAAWVWQQERRPGRGPVLLEDWLFELRSLDPAMAVAGFWRSWIHLAALVRRNQRLGLDAWEGIA